MKRARITLARLMIVVGVVAVELAAFAVAWRNEAVDLALGLAPMVLICEIGLLCAVLSGGRWRAFWTGFVVFGCAMTATYGWALCFQESAASDAWVSYNELVWDALSSMPDDPRWRVVSVEATEAIIWSLPQLAVACAGGVVGYLVSRLRFGVRARDLGPKVPA